MVKPDINNKDRKQSSPGNAQTVPVPHDQALEGSSEKFGAVEGESTTPRPAGEATESDLPTAGDFKSLP
jgi:hypothetical protein